MTKAKLVEELLAQGLTQEKIAKKLGLTYRQVTGLLYRTRRAARRAACANRGDAEYWQNRCRQLERQLASFKSQSVGVEFLLETARQLAPVSYVPPQKVYVRPPKTKKDEHKLVIMLGDTHVGQVVSPSQTMEYGCYDFELFLRRLAHYERSIQSLLNNYAPSEVKEAAVVMLGDMLHGGLKHNAEISQVTTLFDQFFSAGHALAQFIRNLSARLKINVYTVVGNHTRWVWQTQMPTAHRYSNLDQFLYAYLASLLRGTDARVHLTEQPYAKFKVYNTVWYAAHGDQLRGGDYQVGVPAAALARLVHAFGQWAAAAREPSPDYCLFGHLHKPMQVYVGRSECIFNGGFAGLDEYGISRGSAPVPPTQVCCFVHAVHGRTATYYIRLHHGDEIPHHYNVPQKANEQSKH